MVVRTSIVGLLIAVITTILAVAAPSVVRAHGTGVELNKREFAGPYEVVLGIVPDPPSLGEMAVTLTVIELQTRTAVIGADVIMTARGPDSTVIGPLKVETDPTDPSFYDLRTTLGKEGAWIFTVEVRALAGEGSADFAIEVEQPHTVTWITRIITLLTFLALVIILGLAVRAFLGQRRGRGKGLGVIRHRS